MIPNIVVKTWDEASAALTPYCYSTYASVHEIRPSVRNMLMILVESLIRSSTCFFFSSSFAFFALFLFLPRAEPGLQAGAERRVARILMARGGGREVRQDAPQAIPRPRTCVGSSWLHAIAT